MLTIIISSAVGNLTSDIIDKTQEAIKNYYNSTIEKAYNEESVEIYQTNSVDSKCIDVDNVTDIEIIEELDGWYYVFVCSEGKVKRGYIKMDEVKTED